MYSIHHLKDHNTLEVKNSDSSVYGKIYLDEGASLQELTLNGHAIIQDLSPLPYADTYASSILFPFANRIKDGAYQFKGIHYQFEKNQVEEQNALHGLVYNKTFNLIHQETTDTEATVVLEYIETEHSKGFPFTYSIQLEYQFSSNGLSLKVSIENTSDTEFPFTLGWHPYFISANLFDSTLIFDSTKKIVLGDRNITTGTEDILNNEPLEIKDKFLDDCWSLNSDKVLFKTPKYTLQFNATGDNNFLQAYTPPKQNTIAIEPTTGVSDSFNNKIGLETLKPKASHSITWDLKINNE
ncbi:aldose 1-epimerase [Flavobacteriaceae bacterium MHTCC 0001]